MVQTIRDVEQRIAIIKALIHNDFEPTHLEDAEFVKVLTNSVEDTYMLMNEGMCEELTACQRCTKSRDNMRNIMDLLEDIEAGDPVTPEMADRFRHFSVELDEMTERLSEVLAELHR